MRNCLATLIVVAAAFLIVVSERSAAQSPNAASAPATPSNQTLKQASGVETKGMEPKDYIALTVSGLAFVLSLGATVITLRQKKYETERTLRSQLTDAIGKLNSSFEAMEKLREEKAPVWNEPQVVSLKAFYNGQKLSYARQAIYVAKQIPNLVSDGEYNSIARAFVDAGDDPEAFLYYEKAIAAAPDAFYKATNLRGYGRVLIRAGRVEEGRQRFEEALTLVSEGSDSAHWFRAETLQRWAQIEAWREDRPFAEQLLERARTEYSAIKFPPRCSEGLANLAHMRKAISPTPKPNTIPEEAKGA